MSSAKHLAAAAAVLAAAVLIATGACSARAENDDKGGKEEAIRRATEAAESWLGLTDGGEYQESWRRAAEPFKNAVTERGWMQAMMGARKPLGALESREVKSATYATSLPGAPDGEYVVIQFTTAFENKANAIETVTPMKDSDGKWKVSGYYIK